MNIVESCVKVYNINAFFFFLEISISMFVALRCF